MNDPPHLQQIENVRVSPSSTSPFFATSKGIFSLLQLKSEWEEEKEEEESWK